MPSVRALRTLTVAVLAMATLPLSAAATPNPVGPTPAEQSAAHATADRPYLGWSSWSLQSTSYPGVNPNGNYSWLTEAHVLAQAEVMAAKLRSHGYRYINIDSGWFMDFGWNAHIDAFGRPARDTTRFPDPLSVVADRIHALGLKMGLYVPAGMTAQSYQADDPVYGSTDGCTTRKATLTDANGQPEPLHNQWSGYYALDFSAGNPCGYEYVRSVADLFASWGADFVKLDGVTPGSTNNNPSPLTDSSYYEVAAWHRALAEDRWNGQLLLSYTLPIADIGHWQQNSSGVRIDQDVECYCSTIVGGWTNSLTERFTDVVPWVGYARPGFWPNLDSLDVGNGTMDGLTDTERQTYMTLWAVEGAPLYSGDDLTKLDGYGLSLLTNDEVIAVDQAGNPAKPVNQDSPRQVWSARDRDGGVTVALFNLGDSAATVTANWSDLGLAGPATVHDLWQHRNLGRFSGTFSATLPAHGSELLRIHS